MSFNDADLKPIVYVDGENFCFRAAEILIPTGRINEKNDITKFDFRYLLERSLDIESAIIRYYGTKVSVARNNPDVEEKSKRFIARNRALRSSLMAQDIDFIVSGNLKLRDSDVCRNCGTRDVKFQEKGVDVRIAVDLISGSTEGRDVYLVSSDTDLLPAIIPLADRITYVGFPHKLTGALTKAAAGTVVFRESEILEAYDRANNQKRIPLTPK